MPTEGDIQRHALRVVNQFGQIIPLTHLPAQVTMSEQAVTWIVEYDMYGPILIQQIQVVL